MKRIKSDYLLLLVLVVFLFVSYFRLGRDWLYDWDEGIYAQVGQELKLPFLVPFWNGLPWFEKPFFIPLLVKISFSVLGVNEFAARFFMPLLGAGTIYFVYRLLSLWFPKKKAVLATTFFFFAPLFVGRSRMLNTDIALLFFTTASLFYGLSFKEKVKERKKLKFADYLSVAFFVSLAVFTKGVMGFLPLFILGVYLLLSSSDLIFKKENLAYWVRLAALVFLIIAPWHLYMSFCYGKDFWQVYLWEQVLRRAQQPIEYHFGGRLYYFKFLLNEFGWKLIFILLGGVVFLKESVKDKKIRDGFIFFAIWGGLVLFLFTLAKTKLFWYILPLYPVLAVLWANFWGIFEKKLFLLVLILLLFFGGKENLEAVGLRKVKESNPRDELAMEARKLCSPPLLFLVDENERRARDILPPNLKLSSSFSYGGSPSVVFYFQDRVIFYYQVQQFIQDLHQRESGGCVMIKADDYKRVNPGMRVVKRVGEWLLLK